MRCQQRVALRLPAVLNRRQQCPADPANGTLTIGLSTEGRHAWRLAVAHRRPGTVGHPAPAWRYRTHRRESRWPSRLLLLLPFLRSRRPPIGLGSPSPRRSAGLATSAIQHRPVIWAARPTCRRAVVGSTVLAPDCNSNLPGRPGPAAAEPDPALADDSSRSGRTGCWPITATHCARSAA